MNTVLILIYILRHSDAASLIEDHSAQAVKCRLISTQSNTVPFLHIHYLSSSELTEQVESCYSCCPVYVKGLSVEHSCMRVFPACQL